MSRIIISKVTIELGNKRIVPDDLFVDSSSKILYVGRTGSGKTVLLKTLAGIMKDIHSAKIHGTMVIEGRIHYIPQEPWPLNLGNTGYEEILLIAHLHGNKLSNKTKYESFKCCDFLKKKIKEMSYGEKRLLEIIKSTVVSPNILLIDEPYEALDKSNREKVSSIIEGYVNEESVIVVATSKKPIHGWKIRSVNNYSHMKLSEDV
ncbi:MAG: ATP-binding cassette domain-containing protein, partial [Staphylothermus sp.]|nr:ATP-binding cassette domain-containing protein [Staphylothermus sp.]